jgi:hypothetical protein
MKNILLLFVVASLASCQLFKPIVINPKKDPQMLPAIVHCQAMTDSLFTSIQQAPDKDYNYFESRYQIIKSTQDSIYAVDIVRLKSNNIISIVGKLRGIFTQFIAIHKLKSGLPVVQAEIHKQQMDAAYKSLLTAEKALK